MLEVTDNMIQEVEKAIRKWLDAWQTPEDFADYCEYDLCVVMLETIADGSWGIYIPNRVAEWLEIQLAQVDLDFDGGWDAIECAGAVVTEKINDALPKNLPGYVCLGTMEGSGDFGVLYVVPVDDLPYPEPK